MCYCKSAICLISIPRELRSLLALDEMITETDEKLLCLIDFLLLVEYNPVDCLTHCLTVITLKQSEEKVKMTAKKCL